MTPGGVVSTAALAGLLFGPVARLADLAYVFEQAAASVDRLGEILDLEPDVAEPAADARCAARAGPAAWSSSTASASATGRASRSSGTSGCGSSPA